MVNKERVKKLVEALRSEEYTQTTGTLHNLDGYCCLGVACDVFLKETGIGEWSNTREDIGVNLRLQAL